MIALRVLRHGVVVREALVDALPVEIGRAAGSPLVLADASVSRAHARLEHDAEGRPWLRDLGSRNGLRVGGRRVDAVAVEGLLRCHVGDVELEIEPVDTGDTREMPFPRAASAPRARRAWAALGWWGLAVSGWLAVELLDRDLWSPWNDSRGVSLLGTALVAVVALGLVGLALLVALKALGREVHLGDTLGALARLSWLVAGVQALSPAASYLLAPGTVERLSELLLQALGAGGAAYLAGLRRRGPSRGFRLAWALGVALILAGTDVTARLSARHEGRVSVSSEVHPPLLGWPGRSIALETHLAHVRAAAAAADRAARDVRERQQAGE